MDERVATLARRVLALRDGLSNTKNPRELEYRVAVLSLCREITEGPIDAQFGQVVPDSSIMD
jgi:hypothetical protein